MSKKYQISLKSEIIQIIIILISILLPIIPFIFLYRKSKIIRPITSFIAGCLIYFHFGIIFRKLLDIHLFYFYQILKKNNWINSLYCGIISGLFEEFGRFFAFHFTFKKEKKKENVQSLIYGFGHGGFEIWFLLSFNYIKSFIKSYKINHGYYDSEIKNWDQELIKSFEKEIQFLNNLGILYSIGLIYKSSLKMIFQIENSIIIWFGVVKNNLLFMGCIAFVFHFLLVFNLTIIELKITNSDLNKYIIFLFDYCPLTIITISNIFLVIYFWKFYNKEIYIDDTNLIKFDEKEEE